MPSRRVVALIGLPGVGKSTIGRRLAQLLDRPFVDTDQSIEIAEGRTIAELFVAHGEARFRQIEHEALKKILQEDGARVVATGGGAVTDPRTRDLLRQEAFTVYLRSTPARLLPRLVRSDKRPLFRAQDAKAKIEALHAEREPLYAEVASLTVDVAGRPLRALVTDIAARIATGDDSGGAGERPES